MLRGLMNYLMCVEVDLEFLIQPWWPDIRHKSMANYDAFFAHQFIWGQCRQ